MSVLLYFILGILCLDHFESNAFVPSERKIDANHLPREMSRGHLPPEYDEDMYEEEMEMGPPMPMPPQPHHHPPPHHHHDYRPGNGRPESGRPGSGRVPSRERGPPRRGNGRGSHRGPPPSYDDYEGDEYARYV